MKVSSIKEFAVENNFTQLSPKVRVNSNGYPFITFIDSDNKAENVYFSKTAAKNVTEDQPVTANMLKELQIGYTLNEQGEQRIKLISNSERVELASLLA